MFFFFTGLLRGRRIGGTGVSGGHPQPDYWGLPPVHLGRHRLQILQDARQHRVLQSRGSAQHQLAQVGRVCLE